MHSENPPIEVVTTWDIAENVLSKLRHPNLVRIKDYFVTSNGETAIVTEYIKGVNLL